MLKHICVAVFIVVMIMAKSSSSFAACTSPTGVAGDILFNSSMGRVMQSCDGTNWKGWPRAIGSGASGTWKDVRVGLSSSCGIKNDNTLYCWGSNDSGQIGNGSTGGTVLYPTQVSGGGAWIDVSTMGDASPSNSATCGVKMGGALYCWGIFGGSNTPTVQYTGTWDQVEVGQNFGCGIKSDGTLWCFGTDNMGQRGDGGTADGLWPAFAVQESTLSTNWASVSIGQSYGHPCAVKTNGSAYCWGDGTGGMIGNGSTAQQVSPTAVVTTGVQTWKSISAGNDNTCGIKTDGTGWCWGDNTYGQVGRGSTGSTYSSPQALSVSGVTTWSVINAGGANTCGVKTDGTGWCWGYGQEGNVGDGGVVDRNQPTEVLPGAKWKDIRPDWPTCGVMTNGTLWCWGENQWGGQGLGHTNQTNIPNYVAGSSGTGCASPTGVTGDLLFNSAYRVLEWCDGKQWNPAGPISPSGPYAGCTSPTGVAGDLLFNSVSAMHQYCDGDNWRGIAP